jgi:hypothetical protein
MKKILLVSGCSFTTDKFTSAFHPYMDCSWRKWPELLAEKLDMRVVNLARSGSGNEFVFSSLIDKIQELGPERIGMVIPAWSQCQRRDWCENNVWKNMIIPDRGDLKYHINKSMRYYWLFQHFCETHKIKYKQVQMIEFIRKNLSIDKVSVLDKPVNVSPAVGKMYVENSEYYSKINKKNFIGYPLLKELGGFTIQDKVTNNREKSLDDKFKISDEDSHPSEIGHKMIAEYIYENL